MGACDGLRVVELGCGPAIGIVGRVLADAGATVVSFRPRVADRFREVPGWVAWNRGKTLVEDGGSSGLQTLLNGADVVVDGRRADPDAETRVLVDALVDQGLIYCKVRGFGPSARFAGLKGYEGIVAAKAGRMAGMSGIADRDGPVFAAAPVASFGAGQLALQGILAALYVRARTGRGQRVETSMLNGLSIIGSGGWGGAEIFALLPYLTGRTADGHWVQLANTSPHLFRSLLRCLELEGLLEEDRFAAAPIGVAPADIDELRGLILAKLASRTLEHWMGTFSADGNVGGEPFLTAEQALDHPQMQHNGHVIEVSQPDEGTVRMVGRLVITDERTEAAVGPYSIARDGTWHWPSRPAVQHGSADLPAHPLEGITVLEFASYMAAPLGPTLLADLGARVIKVEPLEGDPMRMISLSPVTPNGVQGKESIALDLKSSAGREIVHRLVGQADLLVHNYRPGAPEKLGIDYATVRAINPDLIYLYAAAYGEDGPSSHRPAFHPIPGAVCGAALQQAGLGFPPPADQELDDDELDRISRRLSLANEGSPDPCAALVVGTALLLGLLERELTGSARRLLTTMLCSNAYVNIADSVAFKGKAPRPEPDAGLHGLGAGYRLYPTAEGWVFLACVTEDEWASLWGALGGAVDDPRFTDPGGRREHDAELQAVLAELFGARTADDWESQLVARGVPCVRADVGLLTPPPGVSLMDAASTNAASVEEGLRVEVSHPLSGRYYRHGVGVAMSATPGIARPGCAVGEHGRAILEGLGYPAAKIGELIATGVVAE